MPATTEEQDEQFYRDTESVAFPKLNDHQLSLLEPLAERRVMKRGDVLFKAGQRDLGLAIVLRGEREAFAAIANSRECVFWRAAMRAMDISSMISSTRIASRIDWWNLRANKGRRWVNVFT